MRARPDAIRTFRHLSNMSLEHLAKEAGVSKGYLSRLERGHYDGSWKSLNAIARALTIPVQLIAEVGPTEKAESVG